MSVLAVKPPAQWGLFSKISKGHRPKEILLNDANWASSLTATVIDWNFMICFCNGKFS